MSTSSQPDAPLGLYLHIPFCQARCGYCDFTTFTGLESQMGRYVDALIDEIVLLAGKRPAAASGCVSTVFFGGGTPSLLGGEAVGRILAAINASFSLASGAEITLEANPESVTGEKAAEWVKAGINRLSLGVQAMDNRLLREMDRLHTVEKVHDAYQSARRSGVENVNLDLIYGFKDQSLEEWGDTLRAALALEPEHLSLYALKVEANTPFANRGVVVQEDLEADMYDAARAALDRAGYEQYEISNFARPGRACRHNLIYWRQQAYLGFGVGAVGCVDGLRWQNEKTLPPYFKALEAGRLPRLSEERLDDRTRRFERLMLGLRLREGIRWEDAWSPEWNASRDALRARNLLEEMKPGYWRVPGRAIALTNQVLLPFL